MTLELFLNFADGPGDYCSPGPSVKVHCETDGAVLARLRELTSSNAEGSFMNSTGGTISRHDGLNVP
jgi:hypothetical protein